MRGEAFCCALLLAASLTRVAGAATIAVPGDYATIQDAAINAADGSVIEVAPGHYHGQLLLDAISKSLTIRGNTSDPSAVVIDGDGTARPVVRITNYTGNLVIEGFTITGGNGGAGYSGGVFIGNSSPILRDLVIANNTSDLDGGGAVLLSAGGLFQRCVFRANSAAHIGGAVLVIVGSTTSFEQCQFIDNEAGLTDPRGYGGALAISDSSPTLTGCLVQGNKGRYAGGGIMAMNAWEKPRATLTLTDTTIADNQAIQGDPSLPGAVGGGLHVEQNIVAVLDRCRVRNNVANAGGGLNCHRSRYEITDSVIEDNRADRGTTDGGNGGGIFAASANDSPPVRDPAELVLTRSVVRRNSGDYGGGIFLGGDFLLTTTRATLDMHDSLVADNTSTGSGGGIWLDRTVTTIRNSMFLTNRTTGYYGGGILSGGSSLTTINDSTFAGNESAEQGGGVYAEGGGELHLHDSQFHGNHALSALGGGALAVGAQDGPIENAPITGEVTGSTLIDNGPTVEIFEPDCDNARWSQVTYSGNTIDTSATYVYYRACSGGSTSVAQFDAIGGKATGNAGGPASFAAFMAAPGTIVAGTSSVLAWSAPNEGSLSIDAGIGGVPGPTTTTDVGPLATTTYTLSGDGTPRATATVTVACATLGTSLLQSPINGAGSQDPAAGITLRWYDTIGAVTYDVYLDASADPTTLVAQDVSGTSVTVPGLQLATVYRWKVVAKSPQCASATTSAVFSFQTCASASCGFADGFDDGDAGDWTRFGNGTVAVTDGRLVLHAKRALTVTPPANWVQDGSIALSLTLGARRSESHVLFAYRDQRNYRDLVLSSAGRLKLRDRTNGRVRTLARARRSLPSGTTLALALEIAGPGVRVLVDGAEATTATFGTPNLGGFGVQAVRGDVSVDDVRIDGGLVSRGASVPLSALDPSAFTKAGPGTVRIDGDVLDLRGGRRFQSTAPFFSTGAYGVSASIHLGGRRRSGSLIVFQKDEGNYVEAALDAKRKRLTLQEVMGGRPLGSRTQVPFAGGDGDTAIGLTTAGGQITCTVDGNPVATIPLAGAAHGAIAFRAYASMMRVTNLVASY